ncbi:hypothetical protein NQ315_015276 [Exocentrus adspersus]|uniref:Uncharacterized protein n=1 Tax=Exocentrus adspersus TaxID=1586481 RepID=A0AAV8VAU8_9CUCU|nr:hypothetical protein NQ315_015276 [Exocentrus adspersus]
MNQMTVVLDIQLILTLVTHHISIFSDKKTLDEEEMLLANPANDDPVKIFSSSNTLYAVLRNKTSDVNFCVKKIQELQEIVSKSRDNFDDVWNRFQQLDIPVNKRVCSASRGEDEKTYFQRLAIGIVDNISKHMEIRFKHFQGLKFLELLNFSQSSSIPTGALESLKKGLSHTF